MYNDVAKSSVQQETIHCKPSANQL